MAARILSKHEVGVVRLDQRAGAVVKGARAADAYGAVLAFNLNDRADDRPEPAAGLGVKVLKQRSVRDEVALEGGRAA